MRIAGIVILYHPGTEVAANIHTYLPQVDTLYVADNTEHDLSAVAAQLAVMEKITVLHDGKNEGIAKRLNQAATMAIAAGFEWLLTMDQDSAFTAGAMQAYLQCVAQHGQQESVAMVGVEYEKKPANTHCSSTEVKQLITSGSIVNLQLFKKIGGFDEALFIDEVDTDYCYGAITRGYKIIKFKNIYLHHALGHISYHTSLKSGKTTARTLHSPLRLYYMVRNQLYLSNKYRDEIFLEDRRIKRKDLFHRVKNNLLYGKHRFDTLKYIIKGWIHYKFNMENK